MKVEALYKEAQILELRDQLVSISQGCLPANSMDKNAIYQAFRNRIDENTGFKLKNKVNNLTREIRNITTVNALNSEVLKAKSDLILAQAESIKTEIEAFKKAFDALRKELEALKT